MINTSNAVYPGNFTVTTAKFQVITSPRKFFSWIPRKLEATKLIGHTQVLHGEGLAAEAGAALLAADVEVGRPRGMPAGWPPPLIAEPDLSTGVSSLCHRPRAPHTRWFAAEPEIHRVDPESGSTLRLL
jgi:hypothetical protein